MTELELAEQASFAPPWRDLETPKGLSQRAIRLTFRKALLGLVPVFLDSVHTVRLL